MSVNNFKFLWNIELTTPIATGQASSRTCIVKTKKPKEKSIFNQHYSGRPSKVEHDFTQILSVSWKSKVTWCIYIFPLSLSRAASHAWPHVSYTNTRVSSEQETTRHAATGWCRGRCSIMQLISTCDESLDLFLRDSCNLELLEFQ